MIGAVLFGKLRSFECTPCASTSREELLMTSVDPAAQPAMIKVAVIEDRREIREGLRMLIDGTDSYRCTGSFRSMEEALSRIGADLPDVTLVDIGLPGMN